MNWVFDSIRKSLKTLCRRQSVALVSRISPSTCFLISWVLEIVCCENSCRNWSNYLKNKRTQVSILYASIFFCLKTKNPFPFTSVCARWNVQGMLVLGGLRPSGIEEHLESASSQWQVVSGHSLFLFYGNFKVLLGCHSTGITDKG